MAGGEAYVGRKFRTEFLGPTFFVDEKTRKDFFRVCKELSCQGMAPENAGNVSARTKEGFLIKAGGTSMGELTSEDLVLLIDYDVDSKRALVRGKKEPSSETPMHWLIYARHPEVNAIVHAHDPDVLQRTDLVDKFRIAATSPGLEYGTFEQAEAVADNLDSGYVFITGHGSVSVGSSLQEAFSLMMQVHRRFSDEG